MRKISTQLIIEAKDKASEILTKITGKIKNTGDAASAQEGKLDAITSDVKKVISADKKLAAEQKKLNISSEQLAISEQKLAAQFKKIAADAKKATTQEQKLKVAEARLSAASKSLTNDQKRLNIQLKQQSINSKAAASQNKKLTKSQGILAKSSSRLGAAFGGVNTRFLGLLATFGSFAGFSNVTKEFEALNAGLKTATGSSEAAGQTWQRLSEFAGELGLKVTDVVGAFNTLSNLGLDPSERALESYGNTAKALGKDLDQFIEAVADAATNEFERLKEFGIKAKQQGDDVAFTFQGVTTTVEKNAKAIEGFLIGLGETNFSDAIRDDADNFTANLNRISNSFFELAKSIGESGAADASSTLLSDISKVMKELTSVVQSNGSLIQATFNEIIGSVRLFGNAFVIVFNGIQVIMRSFVFIAFGFAAQVNEALASITFGDTSKEFSANAQAMRETMSDLKKGISEDAESAEAAFNKIGQSFDPIDVSQEINTELEQVKPEIDVFMRPDVQAAVASVVSARDEAQKQVKPIEIPIIYKNQRGNSFSDRPFIEEEALRTGSR